MGEIMQREKQATPRLNLIRRQTLPLAALLRRLAWACLSLLMLIGSATAIQAQVRIMPLGDSLTSSLEGHASYRYWLWKFLTKGGFNVDFVGTISSDFFKPFDQDMEGHPGFTTADIANNITDWASQTDPDIVLLLIGANDIQENLPLGTAVANVSTIVANLRSVNPNVVVLLGLEPPLAGFNRQVRSFNSGLLQLAPRISRSSSPVFVVDLFSGYTIQGDTLDGTHPNVYGDYLLATRWFGTLVPVLHRYFGE